MENDEFAVPADQEILESLGIEPRAMEGDPGVRTMVIESGESDSVSLTCDVPGRSVRIKWMRGSEVLVDVFREGATNLTLEETERETFFVFGFRAGSISGKTRVRIFPEIRIQDTLLWE